MMEYDEIFNHITSIYKTIKDDADGKLEMSNVSVDDFVLDSIEFVQLIVQIEADFNIEFPDELLLQTELNSVGKIASIIETLK